MGVTQDMYSQEYHHKSLKHFKLSEGNFNLKLKINYQKIWTLEKLFQFLSNLIDFRRCILKKYYTFETLICLSLKFFQVVSSYNSSCEKFMIWGYFKNKIDSAAHMREFLTPLKIMIGCKHFFLKHFFLKHFIIL